jgi:Putative collagen-binding domain of a collagenase
MNGRGDDTMTMFAGYAHMVDFFTSFDWWKTAPHDELVDEGKYCLAQPGQIYAIYLPNAGKVTVRLEPGRYQATWFNAFTGEKVPLAPVQGRLWTSPDPPRHNDWALLLLKKETNK